MVDNKFRSRKFILTLGVFAVSVGLLLYGVLNSKDFSTIAISVVGAYSLANAAQAFKK